MTSKRSKNKDVDKSQTQIGLISPHHDAWTRTLDWMGLELTTSNWLEARYEDPHIVWHEVDGYVEHEIPEGLIEDRPGKPPGIYRKR